VQKKISGIGVASHSHAKPHPPHPRFRSLRSALRCRAYRPAFPDVPCASNLLPACDAALPRPRRRGSLPCRHLADSLASLGLDRSILAAAYRLGPHCRLPLRGLRLSTHPLRPLRPLPCELAALRQRVASQPCPFHLRTATVWISPRDMAVPSSPLLRLHVCRLGHSACTSGTALTATA
jgi:hypothetical protein